MRRSFVIYSPGNTGAELIAWNLDKFLKFFAFRDETPHVVRITNNLNFVPDHEDYTCIISKRKNTFDTICDSIISAQKTTDPFSVDPNVFRRLYREIAVFNDTLDLTQYKKVIEVDYDQLLLDPYYLFGQFNIVELTDYNEKVIKRFDYSSIITNSDELKIIYKYLETNAYLTLQNNFTIYSPGRTGSNIIEKNLGNFLHSIFPHHTVTQTANPLVAPDDSNTTCIVSRRKNIFDTVCSLLTVNISGQAENYTGKWLGRFHVNLDEFRKTYFLVKEFYSAIDTSKYKNVVEIDFDTLLTDEYYLFNSLLGIKEKTNYNLVKSSPYNYHELIINYNEVKEYYSGLVNETYKLFPRKFIVYSPTRTGSTILGRNLSKYLNIIDPYKKLYDVVHTHNEYLAPPSTDYVCILSKRESILDTVCSRIMAEKTGEWTDSDYTTQTVNSFSVDLDQFREMCLFVKQFYHNIDLSYFAQVIEVWYNPLMNDPKYLFSLFDQDVTTDYSTNKKSPYNYYNLITNIKELEQIANEVG